MDTMESELIQQQELIIPEPIIRQRIVDTERHKQAIAAGLLPEIANIVASRPFNPNWTPQDLMSAKLRMLDSPQSLADIDKAVLRIVNALNNNEVIGLETDHDCDGQTSHAVLYYALTEYFGHQTNKIRSYIGHRLQEGYGLSQSLAQRILDDDPRPSLIITADNGSSDEPRIQLLKDAGIDVIVTDHHEIPVEGIPQSAYAVINPIRKDCAYPDKYIAGCMVAWLLMAAVRRFLTEKRSAPIASLAQLFDFVAVGTIADCVSMARSANNRAVVAYGIKLIEQASRPCWQAVLSCYGAPLTSEDLGFKIGPLLNSDGRLACAFGSVSFLLSETLEEAKHWIEHLQIQNAERKAIQSNVTNQALLQATIQYQSGKSSICILTEQGHAGVHGISASRIKDQFGRPVIIFCPKIDDTNLLTGSARSIEGIHLRDALQKIADLEPTLIEKFGGHQGAAGLVVQRQYFELFCDRFEQVIAAHPVLFAPVIECDGTLPESLLDLRQLSKIMADLEPFGREFEPPCYEIIAKVNSLTSLGKTGCHAKIAIHFNHRNIDVIWFHCRRFASEPWPLEQNDTVKMVLAPKVQFYRGKTQLSCHVVHAKRIETSTL